MVFMGNGTASMSLLAPVTDIGSPVKPVAAFFHKILAVLVTGGAGSALHVAKNDLSTDILLLAVETVDAEVFGIKKKPPARIEIGETMGTDLFRDGAWVFAEVTSNVFE